MQLLMRLPLRKLLFLRLLYLRWRPLKLKPQPIRFPNPEHSWEWCKTMKDLWWVPSFDYKVPI